jgi:hypothetical protein
MKKIWHLSLLATSVVALLSGCKTPAPPFVPQPIPRATDIDIWVHQLLAADPLLKRCDIQVNTFLGQVMLDGVVDNDEQRQQAVKLVWGVYGVRAVENNLLLRSETGR